MEAAVIRIITWRKIFSLRESRFLIKRETITTAYLDALGNHCFKETFFGEAIPLFINEAQ